MIKVIRRCLSTVCCCLVGTALLVPYILLELGIIAATWLRDTINREMSEWLDATLG